MNRKWYALTLALLIVLSTSCSNIRKNEMSETLAYPIGNGDAKQIAVSSGVIEKQSYKNKIEAEFGSMYGDLTVLQDRDDYSGDGYVTGFNKNTSSSNKIEFEIDIPSSQHYDITVCASSDKEVKNKLCVDQKLVGEFETEDSDGKFILATFYGTYLEKGTVTVSIEQIDGDFDLDYIEINNNESIENISYEVDDTLCNENASDGAKDIMGYLAENYGKNVVTGQYVSGASNREIKAIYDVTGQYPVIRFSDIGKSQYSGSEEIKACIEWNNRGGIVGLMWYWNSPSSKSSVYQSQSNFSLKNAMTDIDIANMSIDEIESLYNDGEISEECLNLVKNIDEVSSQLKVLRDNDVAVLWRPLHEAGGKWFWWGSQGVKEYKWLWELLYTRQTYYHELNNLIWVWNGQDSSYVVDEDMFDIASLDIYLDNTLDFGSCVEQYQWLYNLTDSKKLIAISECGLIPNMNAISRDKAMWSFFGLWYGDYIMDSQGNYSETYNTKEDMITLYNSEATINLYEYVKRGNAKA